MPSFTVSIGPQARPDVVTAAGGLVRLVPVDLAGLPGHVVARY
jgi:hypothetical protein